MQKYIDKLQSKPRRERIFIFWASVFVSVFLVGAIFIASIKSNIKFASMDGNLAAASNVNNANDKAVNFPSIKSALFEFLGAGKDVFNSTKDQMTDVYGTAKEMLKEQNDMENENTGNADELFKGGVPK